MKINFSISSQDFRDSFQEKRPLLLKSAFDSSGFTWKDANSVFERSHVESQDFKVSYDGIRDKSEYVEGYFDVGKLRYRLIKPVIYRLMKQGATLISNKISGEPKVGEVARQISNFTGRQVVSSAYAAFGNVSSFRCHWDTRDVFAVQLIGRKRWIVYEPSFEAPLYTQQSKDFESLYPCPTEPYMDVTLEAGDVFYLPRGWWHNPLPIGEETFHLAIGTFPAFTMDYLAWTVREAQALLPARRSLNNNWEADEQNLRDTAQRLGAMIADSTNYRRFMDEFIAGTREETPLALEVFGRPDVDVLDDDVGLRIAASRVHGIESNYVIANGVKLNLDASGVSLMRRIADNPGIKVGDVLAGVDEADTERARHLVSELCRQDVLALDTAAYGHAG